jgi:hypothetical protein
MEWVPIAALILFFIVLIRFSLKAKEIPFFLTDLGVLTQKVSEANAVRLRKKRELSLKQRDKESGEPEALAQSNQSQTTVGLPKNSAARKS